jgi:hypothetical protein
VFLRTVWVGEAKAEERTPRRESRRGRMGESGRNSSHKAKEDSQGKGRLLVFSMFIENQRLAYFNVIVNLFLN